MNTDLAFKPTFKAIIAGQEYNEMPEDLFIPPDALEVLLDSFSGPLDLLLYLIRKQNIDILNIPIVSITQQYLHYIQLIGFQKLELAADYLLMAAVLAEIKSRLLLPSIPSNEEDEADPRMSLVQRLLAYEQIKEAAQLLDALPRQERDYFSIQLATTEYELPVVHPDVEIADLIDAMKGILQKEINLTHHEISRETLSLRERMNSILQQLNEFNVLEFKQVFTQKEGRSGLVISFLAILELVRQALLIITQNDPFSCIHLRAA